MSLLDRRIEHAAALAAWLADNGQHQRAEQVRGIRRALATTRQAHADAAALRRRMTPIGRAVARASRRPLAEECRSAAAVLDRMAAAAETGGSGPVGIEVRDAAYLADLLRRAADA